MQFYFDFFLSFIHTCFLFLSLSLALSLALSLSLLCFIAEYFLLLQREWVWIVNLLVLIVKDAMLINKNENIATTV